MNLIKRIWTHSMFIIVRMAFVVLVLEAAYDLYSGVPIYWLNELANVLIFTVLFWVVYALAIVMDFRRMRSSPFLVAESVCKQIEQKVSSYKTMEGRTGLFQTSGEDVPVHNPAELAARFEAYIEVLFTIDSGEADRLIARIRKLQAEAERMLARRAPQLETVSEAGG